MVVGFGGSDSESLATLRRMMSCVPEGAPVGPLKDIVNVRDASLASAEEILQKIRLLFKKQASLEAEGRNV